MSREWSLRESAERSHWAEIYRREGPRALWDAAQALLAHMRAIRPEFPDDRTRAEDLAHHQALKDRIGRAAHAFTRR